MPLLIHAINAGGISREDALHTGGQREAGFRDLPRESSRSIDARPVELEATNYLMAHVLRCSRDASLGMCRLQMFESVMQSPYYASQINGAYSVLNVCATNPNSNP